MRRLLNFGASAGVLGLSPLLVSLATFVSVPILLGVLGSDVWYSIALGQSIGEIARALVVWGWNSIGLTVVSPMAPDDRVRYYFRSILPRAIVLIPVGVGSVVLAYLIPSADPMSAVRMSLVGAIYGLAGAWLFIANKEPHKVLLYDGLPRAAAILVASALVLVFESPSMYGWTNIGGSVLAVGIVFVLTARRARRDNVRWTFGTVKQALSALRFGLPIVGSGLVLVLRMSFAVLAVPFIAPAGTALVALGDKFFRWGNTAMTPIMQTLMVRIPRAAGTRRRRVLLGLKVAWGVAGILGAIATVVIVVGSPLISHGNLVLGFDVAIPLGIAIAMVFVAGITGNCVLVMLGRVHQVLVAALAALVVLVCAAIGIGTVFGTAGIFWAFALAEATVVAYQTIVVFVMLRRGVDYA